MIAIRPYTTAEDFSAAIALTRDYIRWLDIDLSFQDIESELANFSAVYGLPQGLFSLA